MTHHLPELQAFIDKIKYWITPFVDEDKSADTMKHIDRFHQEEAQWLYQTLSEQLVGDNNCQWVQPLIRKRYLSEQGHLPLLGSYGMHINWQAPQTGLKRVAHFVVAIIRAYQVVLSNEIPKTNEHAAIITCKEQWKMLFSGMRRPKKTQDEFIHHEDEEKKSIFVIYRGYAWMVQISDEQGRIANAAQLENVLYDIVHNTNDDADLPFSAVSVLPTETALEVRAQLISRDENQKIMRALEKAYFVLSLDGDHINDEQEALQSATFSNGAGFWALKPLNFICQIKDDRIFAHLEPSHLDPLSVSELVALAQYFLGEEDQYRRNDLPDNLNCKAANWTVDGVREVESAEGESVEAIGGTYKAIQEGWKEYQRCADSMMITFYDIFITQEEDKLLAPYPFDAMTHLLLQYAQYKVYGKVRNMTERVEVRHPHNNRFDVMPTVTQESLQFVYALAQEKAHIAQLKQAVIAHERRLKSVRNGEGIYWFYQAMRYWAKEHNKPLTLSHNPYMKAFEKPFIASLSMMRYASISHIAFAPPPETQFALHYVNRRNHLHFNLSHPRNKIPEVEKFTHAIEEGLRQIIILLQEGHSLGDKLYR